MGVKRIGSKDKLLHLLKKNERLTAHQLSEFLGMTEMGVRKHLAALEKDGLVRFENMKQAIGRPVQHFSLTEKADRYFPKNYEGMTVRFLTDIEQLYGPNAVRLLFDRRKHRLISAYEPAVSIGKTVAEKAAALEKQQNARNYMSELKKINDQTFELNEYNCPILAVARQFKLACSRETELIEAVLGEVHVERTMCQADGDRHCRFLIRFENRSPTEKQQTPVDHRT